MSPRSSQRVDRRRRALADDTRNDDAIDRPRIFRAETSALAQRYNKAALQAINAPIAKYIPLRPYYLVVWFLAGLIPIVGLLLLDSYRPEISRYLGAEATRAIDLSATGNLMAWLSSVTFGFAVAVMLGTYSVRRHRRDDYRGRFTVWRWAILCAVLVSIDATVGIHHAWQNLCELASGTSLWRDGKIWWIGTWAILLGGMLSRLMFEMASSKKAVGWTIAAAACYAWSAIVELGVAPIDSEYAAQTSQVTSLLLGHHLMLFSLVNYAREVVLEAMGLLESPVVRREKAQSAKAAKLAEKQAAQEQAMHKRVDESESKKAAKAKTPKATVKATPKPTVKAAEKTKQTKPETGNDIESGKAKDRSTESAPQLRAVVPDEYDDKPAPSKKSSPLGHRLRAVSASEEEVSDYIDDEEEAGNRKMTKAEKRRLRKEQKRRKAA